MKNFFFSLRTAVWTLCALVCVFFIGSYLMPMHRDVHGPMNDRLLFDWALNIAAERLSATWWFFLSVAGLVLLTVNTLVCSIQALRERLGRADLLLRISPQIIHLGFLLILLAHLLGAGWGYRLSGALPEGASGAIPGGRVLHLRSLNIEADERGMPTGWAAGVRILEEGVVMAEGTLGPNRPLFYDGVGVYLKSFGAEPVPYALLMVNRDPGAVWALAGSLLFLFGSAALLALKWRNI